MEFSDCVMQRYATKKFDGRILPQEKINQLIELVRYAPSAINLQPWKIKVITDPKVKEQLRTASNDQPQITSCSHLLVFCADSDYDDLILRLEALMKKNGVPAETVSFVIDLAKGYVKMMTPEQQAAWSQAADVPRPGQRAQWCKIPGL